MKTVDNFINPIMPVILDKNFSREEKFQAIKSIMLEWKSDLCKQQREVCANNYERTRCENLVGVIKDAWDSQRGKNFASSLKDSILNAPEPE